MNNNNASYVKCIMHRSINSKRLINIVILENSEEAGTALGHRALGCEFDSRPKSEGSFMFNFALLLLEIVWLI